MSKRIGDRGVSSLRFASVTEVKDQFSGYLARVRKDKEPIVVTRHGKPYALIPPLSDHDLEELEWNNQERTDWHLRVPAL